MGKGGEESRKILWKRNGGKGEEHNRKGREDMILYFLQRSGHAFVFVHKSNEDAKIDCECHSIMQNIGHASVIASKSIENTPIIIRNEQCS